MAFKLSTYLSFILSFGLLFTVKVYNQSKYFNALVMLELGIRQLTVIGFVKQANHLQENLKTWFS